MTDPVAPDLDALSRWPISATCKGFGPMAARGTVTSAQFATERPRLHGGSFSLPLLTIRQTALQHNLAAMASYCAASGVRLAPHGKTPMAPQLAAAQLGAGAWGLTVATIQQLQTYRHFGFSRLLLANELVDPAGIAWLAAELEADPSFEAYCYADSLAGVELLDAVRGPSVTRRLPVLVELGFTGGRTGARRFADAVAVARAVASSGTLRLAGVAGYEGGLGDAADQTTLDAVAAFSRELRELAIALHAEGLLGDDAIISAGGSAYFDAVVPDLVSGWPAGWAPTPVLRSGSYLTHDHGHYHEVSPAERHTAGALRLLPALELWAPVLSRPEPGLALLGVGRRDVSFDEGMPIPLRVRHRDGTPDSAPGWQVAALNDQHAYLHLPADARLAVGDAVCLGISHPCTCFDKWRVIPVVDDQECVVDAIHTFF